MNGDRFERISPSQDSIIAKKTKKNNLNLKKTMIINRKINIQENMVVAGVVGQWMNEWMNEWGNEASASDRTEWFDDNIKKYKKKELV